MLKGFILASLDRLQYATLVECLRYADMRWASVASPRAPVLEFFGSHIDNELRRLIWINVILQNSDARLHRLT